MWRKLRNQQSSRQKLKPRQREKLGRRLKLIRKRKSRRKLKLSSLRGTSKAHGTPLYNAPEMLVVDALGERAKPSRKTDVYAFGLVCYEVFCKKHKTPFQDFVKTERS
jgi:serine/threonine protein kinase